nr:hypothetical protein [Kitasatospora acidiphila]
MRSILGNCRMSYNCSPAAVEQMRAPQRQSLRAEQAQVVLVGGTRGTRGADAVGAAGDGQPDRRAADPSGGAVDEPGRAVGDAEPVESAGGRLQRDSQARGIDDRSGSGVRP